MNPEVGLRDVYKVSGGMERNLEFEDYLYQYSISTVAGKSSINTNCAI